jgi:hypothetical protein
LTSAPRKKVAVSKSVDDQNKKLTQKENIQSVFRWQKPIE